MNITAIEAIPIAIPYRHNGPATGFGGAVWTTANYLIVRVETDEGLTGYGEAFGYNVIPVTKLFIERNLAPLVVGRDATDIAGLMEDLKKTLHIFGRGGTVQYALSGLDIALWDLAGKRAGVPVWKLAGGHARGAIPVYASLMRLSEPDLVAASCAQALDRGYREIKLHEKTVEAVAAARRASGDGVELMLDVNCAWSPGVAIEMAQKLAPHQLKWLEEPVWPPEDLDGLVRTRRAAAVPIATGENTPNAWAFKALAACEGIDFLQPSVTKVGGITEFLRVGALAGLNGRTLAPHSPYSGPGFLATLHMAAVFAGMGAIERLYIDLEAPVFGAIGLPRPDGTIAIPDGPGLGADPDPEVLRRYRLDL